MLVLALIMSRTPELLRKAQEMGVELERRPAERIVITGFAQLTPLGNTEQTWQGLLEGKSGVKRFPVDKPVNNAFVDIAAPVEFNPEEYFDKRDMRGMAPLTAMGIVVSREAARRANLLGENGKLRPDINKRQAAVWVGSGFGSTQHIIDVYNQIHKKDEEGNEDPTRNSRFIGPTKGLEIFPEQLNARIGMDLGFSGWGGSSVAACATGLDNFNELLDKILQGRVKVGIGGGFENPLEAYPETGIGMFAGMRSVLSTRNDDPERASRPFEINRDGFVLGAGGAVLVAEELEHALKRGAPIYAEVYGFNKSMDGFDPTNLDRDVVASTILGALYNEKAKEFYDVDAIFAHATATKGDIDEADVFRLVFGDEYLRKIPITAIKSNLGHLAGGAGSANAVAAVMAINEGKIPPILNLENPDPAVADLNLVRGKPLQKEINTALVTAYGFGGYNAVLLLGKYKG